MPLGVNGEHDLDPTEANHAFDVGSAPGQVDKNLQSEPDEESVLLIGCGCQTNNTTHCSTFPKLLAVYCLNQTIVEKKRKFKRHDSSRG